MSVTQQGQILTDTAMLAHHSAPGFSPGALSLCKTMLAKLDSARMRYMTDPDGEQLTYGFDAGGHVKTATGTLRKARYDYLRHIGYDEFGNRARMVYGNSVETSYAFDPQSRYLTQLR